MARKLTLTTIFMLGFLSLGIIAEGVALGNVLINKAFAAGDSNNGGGK